MVRLVVVEDHVALGGGPALDVLAGEPDRRPLREQRGKASCSACAQSIPPSAPRASRRRSSCLTSLGWIVKPSGTPRSSSFNERSRSAETAVFTSGEGERSSSYCPVVC